MPMGFVFVCVLLPVSWLLRTFEQWFMCVCVCVLCSSSMKRLPFSDEDFVSPPNKMAREEEPKKGTRYVCTLLGSFDCSHGEVFEWRFSQGLNRCVHMHAHVCVCCDWLHEGNHTLSFSGPCDYTRSFKTSTRGRCLHWPNKIPLISECTHANKPVPFTLYPIHRLKASFPILNM